MYSLKKGSRIFIVWGGKDDSVGIAAYYKYKMDFEVVGIIDTELKEETVRDGIVFFPPNKLHDLGGVLR